MQLQGSSQDVLDAYREIEVVKATLEDERRKVDEAFKRPYQKMCELARLAGNDEGLYVRTKVLRTANIEQELPARNIRRVLE